MKIVDSCESNKQMERVYVSRISMKPYKIEGRSCRLPGKPWQTQVKMPVKERKVRNSCG